MFLNWNVSQLLFRVIKMSLYELKLKPHYAAVISLVSKLLKIPQATNPAIKQSLQKPRPWPPNARNQHSAKRLSHESEVFHFFSDRYFSVFLYHASVSTALMCSCSEGNGLAVSDIFIWLLENQEQAKRWTSEEDTPKQVASQPLLAYVQCTFEGQMRMASKYTKVSPKSLAKEWKRTATSA